METPGTFTYEKKHKERREEMETPGILTNLNYTFGELRNGDAW